ncbi:hypothetical protein M1B78_08425 [Bacteroides sp. KH569_7]|uniref:Uncharacterized protein n=1 Tax=Bacteroides muris (ex Fokt et al. 2023) TaxID=2937417 RepID=A0A9X2SWZ3_9BACE|nr:hypothetical protein [Bacteroides muris (ex Fokt et al. 2023)]MCR6508187.1 hypothetical protein [Bacteroides muris (ex Fokt et al. 2023)]
MNHKLMKWVISSNMRVELINFLYKTKNKKFFFQEIADRKKVSLFNYTKLIEPLPYVPTELVIDNNLYGIAYALKKYAGIDTNKSLDAYIEHGIFFGNLVRDEQKIWNVSQNITFSNIRKKHLLDSKIQKEILPIGPFIHYAESLLNDDELKELKSKMGRVLLVFPSHSIIGVNSSFSHDDFIKEIERIRKDFDTVLVSLYWVDACKLNILQTYEAKGYKVVTSGHRYDLYFLCRQKALIQLADFTMSNSVGTHVGYCIYLNKPHYIYQQKIKNVGINERLQKHFDAVRNEEQLLTEEKEKNEIFSLFSKYQENISEEQYAIVDKYWGVSLLLSSDRLRDKLLVR